MNENWKKIKDLLKRFEQGSLSQEEVEELDNWYESIHFNEMPQLAEEEFREETYFREKYDDLMERVERKRQPPKVVRINYRAVAAAAIIVLLCGVFWIQYNKNDQQKAIVEVNKKPLDVNDILPGHGGAVLSLSNGEEIVLDSASVGYIAKQGSATIDNRNGVLTYNAQNAVSEKLEYNTLTIPAGREYQLELPDGSKVWLNASSSLSFPVVFAKGERQVTLQGEAYFEVAKAYLPDGSRKPFKISINTNLGEQHQVEMEVLGTSFNVNAYNNEPEIKTTLVEGSVKINTDGSSMMLSPARQAVVDANGKTRIESKINMKQILAWREGVFYFDHSDLHSILRQFSRWYDMDIISNDTATGRSFSGKINRNVKLVDVLKIMDLSNINYTMEGKKMIIKNL